MVLALDDGMAIFLPLCSKYLRSGERELSSFGSISSLVGKGTIPSTANGQGDTLPSQPSTITSSPRVNEKHAFMSDKYTIEGTLGSGGMGVVYAARHRFTGQAVALKVIRPVYTKIPEAVDRFLREARVLALIDSPGVVRLLDCDFSEDGVPFMTMELLHGHDLRVELDHHDGAGLLPEDALNLVFEVSRTLAVVHDLGIVHRDIKPENIVLCTSESQLGRTKLIDFGVARLSLHSKPITRPSNVVGSLRYMSPEQLKNSHDVTPATDVWSLGVLLVELLGGASLFRGGGQAAQPIGLAVSVGQPPRLLDVCPTAPPALARIVDRCLQSNPANRYQDARGMSNDLFSYVCDLRRLRPAEDGPLPSHREPVDSGVRSRALAYGWPD